RGSLRCLCKSLVPTAFIVFFCTPPAPTEISPLSLHDALPISSSPRGACTSCPRATTASRPSSGSLKRSSRPRATPCCFESSDSRDRKSTRLNSSHLVISYAVFCLKKKKKKKLTNTTPDTHHSL